MPKRNKKIDYYTLALLKENLPFFILIVINFIILIFLKSYFNNYNKNIKLLENLKKEVSVIEQSQKEIQNFSVNREKLNKYYQLVNLLLPDKEDIFSIIAALERLSQITGFYITNYSFDVSKIKEKTSNNLEVIISGIGDSNSFMKLLKEYNFASGRLITMDNLTYSTSNQSSIRLVFKFYTRKSPKLTDFTKIILPTKEQFEWIEKIAQKVKVENIPVINSEDILYKTKSNPFD